MAKLVIDIETIGEDFDSIDEISQDSLTKYIKKNSPTDEIYEQALEEVKATTGLSPLTGEIVVIGLLDYQKNKGTVYYQAPGEKEKEKTEGNFTFKVATEEEMLTNFWRGATEYDEFITFNGRGFDAPYLMVRSAIHGIKPSKDLMSNRYISSQKYGAKHYDLQDLLTFYGATQRKGSLHMWTRAFGIESPKNEEISGENVGEYFKKKKYLDIARYNVRDLVATKELFDRWLNFLSVN